MSRFILSLDEGTSSARAALYDAEGRRVAMESATFSTTYPHPGWVEQDPEEIWAAQLSAARHALAKARVQADQVAAIGITNQRETTVLWNRKTGKPVAPAIVWQCRRTADRCREIAEERGSWITAKTGLVPDAYFSGTKAEWVLRNIPGLDPADLLFGTIDSWLVWKLTNGAAHVTDVSNASRTMLMDLDTGQWDPELLEMFRLRREMLPRIARSSEIVGVAAADHFGAEIPIAGIAGDQQAALFGQACFSPGLSKNTYGTGCFALLHTGAVRPPAKHGLLATSAAQPGSIPQYAVEGSVFVSGAAVQWLRDQLGVLRTAAESDAVARSVPNTGGVYFVPAFVGLGAPYWNMEARGAITGLTRGTTSAHVVRATLEAIAYQTRDLVEAMQAGGQPLRELRVDGGASANDFLMQFQADILGCPIVRPADIETTALGAAYLAGLAVGYWRSVDEVSKFWRAERIFEPTLSATLREDLYAGWKHAVGRALWKA